MMPQWIAYGKTFKTGLSFKTGKSRGQIKSWKRQIGKYYIETMESLYFQCVKSANGIWMFNPRSPDFEMNTQESCSPLSRLWYERWSWDDIVYWFFLCMFFNTESSWNTNYSMTHNWDLPDHIVHQINSTIRRYVHSVPGWRQTSQNKR
jgi:hypothetical protein